MNLHSLLKFFSIFVLTLFLFPFPRPVFATDKNQYTSYTNKTFGFSVELPDNYISETKGQALVFSGPPGSMQWQTTINFQVLQSKGQTPTSFIDTLKAQWAALDYSRLLQEQAGKLDGFKAVRLLVEFKVPNESELIRQEQFVLQHPDYFYMISYTAPARLFEQHHGVMARALDTFHIVSPYANTPTFQSTKHDQEILQNFIASVQTFQKQNSSDGITGWNNYTDPLVLQYLNTLNLDIWPENESSSVWAYYFSLSLTDIGQLLSTLPVVGFYHPWSDVWVVTQWQKEPSPRILSVEIILGEWVRNHGLPPLDLIPAWLQGDAFRPGQLGKAVAANLKHFDNAVNGKNPWRKTLRLTANRSLLEKANYPAASNAILFSWLRTMELSQTNHQDTVPNDLLAAAQQFLDKGMQGQIVKVIGSATETLPETRQTVTALPSDFFSSLNPVYWTEDKKWATLYLVPASNSNYCLTLRYLKAFPHLQLKRIDLLFFPAIVKYYNKGRIHE